MLTVERLKSLFSYNENNGSFVRLKRAGSYKAGVVAGVKQNNGYIVIGVDGKKFLGHRLAWLYMTGEFPQGDIDHINGIRDDNRFVNLRQCNRAENMQNIVGTREGTSSGYIGVSFQKGVNLYRARIWLNNKCRHIGYYETAEAAHHAYLAKKAAIHKFQGAPRKAED